MGGGFEHVARVPLLDRLTDRQPGQRTEPQTLRTLTRVQLLSSVRREVEQLLGTRCSLTIDEVLTRSRSVLDYGLPDFSHLNAYSAVDMALLARLITLTIEAFEPRLCQVQVAVTGFRPADSRAFLTISAVLRVEHLREAVTFPVMLGGRGQDDHGV